MSKPFRQAVMAIILKPNGTFLIGSSPRDGGYKFPQGGIDEDESHVEGLKRELLEELNLTILDEDIIKKLPSSFVYPYPDHKPYSKKYSGQVLHVFVIRHREDLLPIPQDNEFDQMIWITSDQMDQYDFCHRRDVYHSAIRASIPFNP